MARNKLTDLNDHLFAQLERLGDEDLTQEELKIEVTRAKSISFVAKNIIENAKVVLDGAKFSQQELPNNQEAPEMFKLKK